MIAALLRDRRAWGGVAALAAAVVVLVVFVLGGSGAAGAPATGAAKLIPSDALAYVHVSTDPDRAATSHAVTLLERLPSFAGLGRRAASSLRRFGRGTGVDFARDIRPWLGREAAFALLDTKSATAGTLFVLDVRDRAKAREFLQRLGAPTSRLRYRGVPVSVYSNEAVAFVSHYLVAGTLPALKLAVVVHAHPSASLAESAAYARATVGEPDGRVLDAYASADGIDRVLAPQGGALGLLGTVLRQPSLEGAALSLTAHGDTFTLREHSSLVGGAKSSTGGLPLPAFSPSLAGVVPGPVIAFADVGGLARAIPRLLGAGAAGRTLTGVAAALKRAGGDLQRDVVKPLASHEVAAALLPSSSPVPVLVVVAKARDQARARQAMASLQLPLSRLAASATGGDQALAVFRQRTVDGIAAYQLRVSPALELDYAVFDGRLVFTTSLQAIAALHAGKGSVGDQASYRATVSPQGTGTTSLVFLDLSKLLDIAEQAGLQSNPQYLEVRDDLRKVRAIGLETATGEAQSTVEISVQIR